MKKPGLPGKVDYSFGPGTSPVTGAALAALTTLAVVAPLFTFAHVKPFWGLLGGVVTTTAAFISLAATKPVPYHEGRALAYRAVCWLGAGCWAWWQLGHHPWSWDGVWALGIGGLVAAVAGSVLARVEDRTADQQLSQAVAALSQEQNVTREKLRERWEPLIEKVTRIPVSIPTIDLWPDGTGYTLEAELPLDGTTIGDLKQYEEALATAAGLKPGCNVLITAPDVPEDVARNVVWLRVNTVNAMARDLDMPDKCEPRTINNPVPFGVVTNGSIGACDLRERCMALAGESGSGKSTALNVGIHGLAQCTDVFLVMIDTKGGGECARRWVRAAREGRADRPVLGLVANTDPLAEWLLTGLRNIVDGRPTAYAELMHQQNADKVIPTPELPQIVLVVDEFKSLTDYAKELIEYIADKGRSAAVRMILSTLDPTQAGIPTPIIRQCRERYGLRIGDEADMHHLFNRGGKWTARFDPASMTHPGMGLISTNAQLPVQVKGWKLDPEQIDVRSIQLAPLRPHLDQPSIDMFDTIVIPGPHRGDADVTVTNLWERFWPMTIKAMFPDGPTGGGTPVPAPAPRRPAGPAAAMDAGLAGMATTIREMDEAGARLRAAMDAADQDNDGEDADPEFAALVGRSLDDVTVAEARDRYRDLLREMGPTGATEIVERLQREGYSTVRSTVQAWLKTDESEGKTSNTTPKLPNGWIWTGDRP